MELIKRKNPALKLLHNTYFVLHCLIKLELSLGTKVHKLDIFFFFNDSGFKEIDLLQSLYASG